MADIDGGGGVYGDPYDPYRGLSPQDLYTLVMATRGGQEHDNPYGSDYLTAVSQTQPRVNTPYITPNSQASRDWYFMGDAPSPRPQIILDPITNQPTGGFTGVRGSTPSPLLNTLVDYAVKTGWQPTLAHPLVEPQGMELRPGPIDPTAAQHLGRLDAALAAHQPVPIQALQDAANYLSNDWVLRKKGRSLATNIGVGAATTLGAIAGSAVPGLGTIAGGAAGAALANAAVQGAAQRSEPGTFNPYEVGAAGASGAAGGLLQGADPWVQAGVRAGTGAAGNIAGQYGQTGQVNWPSVLASAAGGAVASGIPALGNSAFFSEPSGVPLTVGDQIGRVGTGAAGSAAGGAVSGAITGRSRNPFIDATTGLAGSVPSWLYQGGPR